MNFAFWAHLTTWPLITFDLGMTFDCMNIQRVPYCINKPSLVPIGLHFFKWGECYILSPSYNLTSDDFWPWYMTFDCMNIQRVLYCIDKPSLVPIRLPTFQMRPLLHFQPILQLDLRWPLTLICELWPHQQLRVPTLHLWPNFGWNQSKNVDGRDKC